MQRATAVASIVIGLAAAHAASLAVFAFGPCSAGASEPGEAQGDETCRGSLSLPALGIALLLAVVAVCVALSPPPLAWMAAIFALGLALLFGLSVGGVLLPHVAAVLVTLGVWHGLTRRARRAEPPPAP